MRNEKTPGECSSGVFLFATFGAWKVSFLLFFHFDGI